MLCKNTLGTLEVSEGFSLVPDDPLVEIAVGPFSLEFLTDASSGGGEFSSGGSAGSGGGGGIRDMIYSGRHEGICFDDSSLVEGMKYGGDSANDVVSMLRSEMNAFKIGASILC